VNAAWLLATALVAVAALEPASLDQDEAAGPSSASPYPERDGIEARHPSEMIELAERLFATEDGKEEGLFWYYAGDLRWKGLVSCTDPFPTEEVRRMNARMNEVGGPIRAWSGENIDILLATFDKVEAWDKATSTRYAKGPNCEAEAQFLRGTIDQVRQYVIANRAEHEAMLKEKKAQEAAAPDGP